MKKILVIDDQEEITTVYGRYFLAQPEMTQGFEYLTPINDPVDVPNLLMRVKELAPDLIVMDHGFINRLDLDGCVLIEALRLNGYAGKIIGNSANGQESFIAVAHLIDGYNSDKGSFQTLFYKITRILEPVDF